MERTSEDNPVPNIASASRSSLSIAEHSASASSVDLSSQDFPSAVSVGTGTVSQQNISPSPANPSVSTVQSTDLEESGDVELSVLSRQSTVATEASGTTRTAEERLVSNLAPVDTGRGAWSYLVGAFIVETVSWSFPTSYGLFLPAYMADPMFGSQPGSQALLPLVGTLGSGLMYCSGPLIYPLIIRFPRTRRPCLWIGALLCWLSLFSSSYVTSITSILMLQGVLYGIGGAVLYAPCMSYLSEWFVARRGTANGIIFAGTAAGGVLLPLILPYLIGPYGPQVAVRYLSLGVLGSLLPALLLIKPRLRDPRVVRTGARGRVGGWMRNRGLWILMGANTLQALAYFVPVIWLPTFASALNLTNEQGSIALILVNGVSVLSRVGLGILADRLSPWALALGTLSSVSVFTFVIWGYFATTLSTLFVYCISYGIMAGGWTSLWTGFMKPITHDDPVSSTTVLGFLLLSRGIGNVLSAPISTALLHPQRGTGGRTGFEVGGSMFESLIIYTGILFGGAALLIGAGWGLEWLLSEREDVEGRSR